MRSRAALIVVLAAGTVLASRAAAETTAQQRTDKQTTTERASTKRAAVKKKKRAHRPRKKSRRASSKAKAKATAKSKSKSKARRKGKQLAVSRTPTAASLRVLKNMPRGYAWPPTEKMREAGRTCEARLDDLGVAWKRAEPEGRIATPLTVADEAGGISLGGITYKSKWRKPPHKMDCMFALALHTFGAELHGLGVREITFGSIYRWTNVRVNGKNRNMLSRHGLGIAMDIVSFTDLNGRVISVEDDYPKDDPLLLGVEAAVNSSPMFRVLLTPRNDPKSHHDHFHIEVAIDYDDVDALAPKPALPDLPLFRFSRPPP